MRGSRHETNRQGSQDADGSSHNILAKTLDGGNVDGPSTTNYNVIVIPKIDSKGLQVLRKGATTATPLQSVPFDDVEIDDKEYEQPRSNAWLGVGLAAGVVGMLGAMFWIVRYTKQRRLQREAAARKFLDTVDNNLELRADSLVHPRAHTRAQSRRPTGSKRSTERTGWPANGSRISSSTGASSSYESSVSTGLGSADESHSRFPTLASTGSSISRGTRGRRHHHHVSSGTFRTTGSKTAGVRTAGEKFSKVGKDIVVNAGGEEYCCCGSPLSSPAAQLMRRNPTKPVAVNGNGFKETVFGGMPISLRCASCGGFRRDQQPILIEPTKTSRALKSGEENVIHVDVDAQQVNLSANGMKTVVPLGNGAR